MTDTLIRDILEQHTDADIPYDKEQFIERVLKLYRFMPFKLLLDVILSCAKDRKASFRIIEDKGGVVLTDGHCQTMEGIEYNPLLGRFFKKRQHVITIRKNTVEVVIHEIAHAIEKESGLNLRDQFMGCVEQDIKNKRGNLAIAQAIHNVMCLELKSYKEPQKPSEFFARYFQLLAMSKEVLGHEARHGFKFEHIDDFFVNTKRFVETSLRDALLPLEDQDIARASKVLQRAPEEVQSSWNEVIKPLHYKAEDGKAAWKKVIRSKLRPGETE